jgi:arylsulfatase A-like enzyme
MKNQDSTINNDGIKRRAMLRWAGITAGTIGLLGQVPVAAHHDHENSLPDKDDASPSKPNIIYILADDLGYGDVGCYNNYSRIPTPNIDQLAAEGMLFTDSHAPTSVSTPTRYALLTGRYSWRTRLQRGVGPAGNDCLISPDRLTVGKLLQQHGYSTAAIGKWHLGWENWQQASIIKGGPTERGFDYFFGTVGNELWGVRKPVAPEMEGQIFENRGLLPQSVTSVDYVTTLAKRSVEWVEAAAGSGKPFFLYLALPSPHYPVLPAPEFKGKSQVGDYGDYVFETDWVVGQVLDALKRSGTAENTLVIFTSDNGPEITGEVSPGVYDRAQLYQHFSMGELRGAKRDLWEGGHRVPFITRWPGKIKSGAVNNETICHVDFLATIAALLGAQLPPNAGEDSYNFLPVLLGEKHKKPVREATVHHSASGKFAIRKGDWVLIDSPTGDDNGEKKGEPQWLKDQRGYTKHELPGELFNLSDDASQRLNLYAERPKVVRELKSLLEKYKRDGRSAPGVPQKNDVAIGSGK